MLTGKAAEQVLAYEEFQYKFLQEERHEET